MLKIVDDIRAIYRNDPAAKNIEFILYPSFQAIFFHRIIHVLWNLGVPFFPRLFSQISRFFTGLEIHPGAKIGRGFFVDHGAGVVIGETTIIGEKVVLFHNVTLGGTGKHHGKRHPTIGNNVLIGTGATLLGPVTVGDNVKIGAGSFIFMRDVPSNCTVAGVPARIVKRDGQRVDEPLPGTKIARSELENSTFDGLK
jgi:serine O-acetyltransferase